MPFHLLPPEAGAVGKIGFGSIGAICGLIIVAAAGGYLAGIAAAIGLGLIGVIGGAFFDGDYQYPVYRTAPQNERAWAVLGYTILLGLTVTIFGIILSFFVPDWRPFLIAAVGMLFVVIALSYGEMALL